MILSKSYNALLKLLEKIKYIKFYYYSIYIYTIKWHQHNKWIKQRNLIL